MKFLKHIAIFILLLQLFSCNNNDENKYQISGIITGMDTGTISIIEFTGNGDEFLIDKSPIKNGTFSFSGKILRPKPVYVTINDNYDFTLFLEPEIINISIDSLPNSNEEYTYLEPVINGGVENKIYSNFLKTRDSINELMRFKQIDILIDEQSIALKNNNTAKANSLEKTINKLEIEINNLLHNNRKKFILNHPKSIVAPYVLLNEGDGMATDVFTEKELETVVTNFDKSIAYSNDYKECVYNLTAIKNLAIGKTAPDFTLKNQLNESISLKDYRGKIVLIDFWAYWCAPCVEEFPYLKELHSTYNNKGFEIISISDDPDTNSWKEALAEHKMPWQQCITGLEAEMDVSRKYYIENLPTTYLISETGIILGKNLDRKSLENVLKNKLK